MTFAFFLPLAQTVPLALTLVLTLTLTVTRLVQGVIVESKSGREVEQG